MLLLGPHVEHVVGLMRGFEDFHAGVGGVDVPAQLRELRRGDAVGMRNDDEVRPAQGGDRLAQVAQREQASAAETGCAR